MGASAQTSIWLVLINNVAAAVHRSPAHVTTALRRATGKSAVAWIITGRLAEARRRLVSSDERVDVIFGLRTVQGELVVQSANSELDAALTERSKFQIVANLKRDEAEGAKRTLSFDDCFIEGKSFALSSGGSVSTTYTFTATRAREE